jgi:hypothetical protein
MRILIFLTIIGCTMTSILEDPIFELFDRVELKKINSNSSVAYEKQKNIAQFINGNLASMSEAEANVFIKYYPDAVKLFDYYPLTVFFCEEYHLIVLLFIEYSAADKQSNLIVQPIKNNKPLSSFNISKEFVDFEIGDIEELVTFNDGFKSYEGKSEAFTISIFKTPKEAEADFGELYISKTGEIGFEVSNDIP